MQTLLAKGIVPIVHDLDKLHQEGKLTDEIEDQAALRLGSLIP
jgi:hypothetical protein